MNVADLAFPSSVADEVLRRLKDLFDVWAKEPRNRVPEPRPDGDPKTRDYLHAVLSHAFYASLEREEDRPVVATYFLGGRLDAATQPNIVWDTHELAEPVPLSVEAVRKLAPALDPRVSAIGVGPDLKIWGFVHHGGALERLDASEHKSAHYASGLQTSLWVSSSSPGELVVSWGRLTRLALFAKGRLERPSLRVLYVDGPVHDALGDLGESARQHERIPSPRFAGIYGDVVRRVLRTADRAGHGAIVLLLPSRDLTDIQVGRGAPTRASRRVAEYAAAWDEVESKYPATLAAAADPSKSGRLGPRDLHDLVVQRDALHWNLLDAADYMGHLACVDGALVLAPDLSVLTFGAKILLASSKDGVPAAENELGDVTGEPFVPAGTRHGSVASYCRAHPGAVGFVLSQDRTISCFYNDGELYRVWRPVDLEMTYGTIASYTDEQRERVAVHRRRRQERRAAAQKQGGS